MASTDSDSDVSNSTRIFNLDDVIVYNVVNVGRYVVSCFANIYNFCCELKLLNHKCNCSRYRNCSHYRRKPKLSIDRRAAQATSRSFVVQINYKNTDKWRICIFQLISEGSFLTTDGRLNTVCQIRTVDMMDYCLCSANICIIDDTKMIRTVSWPAFITAPSSIHTSNLQVHFKRYLLTYF